MAAIAATLADADFAERQSKVVADDEKMVERDFLLLHPICNSLPAQIHVSGWLDENKGAATRFHLRAIGVTNLAKSSIGCLSQGIQYFKSYVVAGVGVFSADVAQPYNQIFHPSRLFCFSGSGISVKSRTGHLNSRNHNVFSVKDFETVEAQILNLDSLSKAKVGNVNFEDVRKF